MCYACSLAAMSSGCSLAVSYPCSLAAMSYACSVVCRSHPLSPISLNSACTRLDVSHYLEKGRAGGRLSLLLPLLRARARELVTKTQQGESKCRSHPLSPVSLNSACTRQDVSHYLEKGRAGGRLSLLLPPLRARARELVSKTQQGESKRQQRELVP
jgi:hypothetical protein